MKKIISAILNKLILVIFFGVLAALVAEFGFYLDQRSLGYIHLYYTIVLWIFPFYLLIKFWIHDFSFAYIRSRWFESFLSILIIFHLIYIVYHLYQSNFSFDSIENIPIRRIWILMTQVGIFLLLISESTMINTFFVRLKLSAAQILIITFAFLILVGTGMLMLPKALAPGHTLSFVDALFTATSATCVTGLIVVDTGTHFSTLGQTVILMLIQIGGLGIMTFTSFFVVIFRRNISLREKSLVREIMNYDLTGVINQVLIYSILLTFALEFLGAILLYLFWGDHFIGTAEAIYYSVFHSVSAFCNAGFSLFSDSLESFYANYGVLFTIAILIILGGIGFPVLINFFRLPLLKKFSLKINSYRLHTRLVVITSGILILIGTLLLLLGDWNHTLADFHLSDKLVHAFFQSVTARTAGFNSVPIGEMSLFSLIILMFLMYVGASPGSTGGGIKTTTAAILMSSFRMIFKNRETLEMFKREIPLEVFKRAVAVMVASLVYLFVAISLLVLFNPHLPFDKLLFELISAFGTVGLSTGITAQLTTIGKWIIIVTMFFGRVGVITLVLLIMTPERFQQRYHYPTANIMVG